MDWSNEWLANHGPLAGRGNACPVYRSTRSDEGFP